MIFIYKKFYINYKNNFFRGGSYGKQITNEIY